jgi:hypothetical protein
MIIRQLSSGHGTRQVRDGDFGWWATLKSDSALASVWELLFVRESASRPTIEKCNHQNEETLRDLPELQTRHGGTQRAHLPQEAKMAVPEVQEGPNAGAQAALGWHS